MPSFSAPTSPTFGRKPKRQPRKGACVTNSKSHSNDDTISDYQAKAKHRHMSFDVSHTMNRLKGNFVGSTDTEQRMSMARDSPTILHRDDTDMDLDEEVDHMYYGKELEYRYQHYLSIGESDLESSFTSRKEMEPPKKNLFTRPSTSSSKSPSSVSKSDVQSKILRALHQIPAIALIAMFHLMIGVPFGVSYFPIGWREGGGNAEDNVDDDDVHGTFPIVGKDQLGIRMFLFSTIIGQLAFTFTSGFHNPISIQMVENVPFCQSLAHIVIKHAGYGMKSLSTIVFMFGLSSVLVGLVFYTLGRLELGRIIYFFPTHVLVGCIGGIGIFIVKTGVEVTINQTLTMETLADAHSLNLFMVVVFYEVVLRVLEWANVRVIGLANSSDGEKKKPRYALLSPIYFCMITPIFYLALWAFGVDLQDANDAGYFFPKLESSCRTEDCSSSMMDSWWDTVFNEDLFDMWRVIDFSNICWPAIVESIPTLIALSLFSLIHVPINIPAFAISTNTEADMNKELVAHGYSNLLAGLCGGLQNYMAYTQSVLYARSGGLGKTSGVAVVLATSVLFIVGPTIASYIPRCMAGTLLLHVGIDLFLEGVYDTYGKFERLEYAGTWLITIVMTLYGMNAAMIAGGISAVSTYAVQTIAYLHPIRGQMTAVTLRSSRRDRNRLANVILDDPDIGRTRILVIQLQGHMFFGNMAQLNESISNILDSKDKDKGHIQPWIIIMDFSLVLGIDSSAAQAIIKLNKMMRKKFDVQLCIFVTGSSDGFPCDYSLSEELINVMGDVELSKHGGNASGDFANEETALLARKIIDGAYTGSQVCQTLDLALVISEDALISKKNPSLLEDELDIIQEETLPENMEQFAGMRYLRNMCPQEVKESDLETLCSLFQKQVYQKGDILWMQASDSDCAKLVIMGTLLATLDNEAGTSETVPAGRMVGELGLVSGTPRMSSLKCISNEAIVLHLGKEDFDELVHSNPSAARVMDLICINYLASRVQHVSNRIFETRCLPI